VVGPNMKFLTSMRIVLGVSAIAPLAAAQHKSAATAAAHEDRDRRFSKVVFMAAP
jgi:hypothetical protein